MQHLLHSFYLTSHDSGQFAEIKSDHNRAKLKNNEKSKHTAMGSFMGNTKRAIFRMIQKMDKLNN